MYAGCLSPMVGVNHPPLASAEVKEREELYHYSSVANVSLYENWSAN